MSSQSSPRMPLETDRQQPTGIVIELPRPRSSRLAAVAAATLVAYGIVLRLAAYLSDRSFWGDEVAVALNVRLRDFMGLFRPLDYEQTMPIALLIGIKSTVAAFGTSEYVFRLPLLIGGCCSLPALWLVFRRLFGSQVALIGLAIASIFRPLIYYSSEVKQYELDALITIITLWLGFEALTSEGSRRWRILIGWGVLALCLSQPAVFLLVAVGLAAILDARFWTWARWRHYTFTAGTVWLGVFLALYFFCYRVVSHSPYMRAFWSSSFIYPASRTLPHQLTNAIYVLLGTQYFDHSRTIILALLLLLGLFGIWQQHRLRGIILAISPLASLLAAAALKQYPVSPRLVLFIFPVAVWIYAMGIATLAHRVWPKMQNAMSFVLTVALFGPTAIGSINYALNFPQRETSRQMVAYINANDPSASIYIVFDEYLPWAYYGGDWAHPEILKNRAQLAFHSPHRIEFIDNSGDTIKEEIVGPFPSERTVNSDDDLRWAHGEATAILALRDSHVWLFLPNSAMGHHVRQRKVLEKLEEELTRGGARLVNSYSMGDSIARRYQLPQRALMPTG
jgi:hypothetical protein